ncbi:MAG: tetratricopeptide repeat protein [Oscillospiraceae bacterium]
MAVELVSKQMKLNGISTDEMYSKLCKIGIYADEKKVKNIKDGKLKSQTAYTHIETLFNIFGTNESEKQILRCISLVGSTPMAKDFFTELCELSDTEKETLKKLIRCGWIYSYMENGTEILLIHSLICEVLLGQLKPDYKECEEFIISCSCTASFIDMLANAYDRKSYIRYLDHVAHSVKGKSKALADFYNDIMHLYAQENNYSLALWAADKALEIFKEFPDCIEKIISVLISAKSYSGKIKNTDAQKKYDNILKEIPLSDADMIKQLETSLLDFISDRKKSDAVSTAKYIIELAEKNEDDKILASAYDNMITVIDTFNLDYDREKYLSLFSYHAEKYYDVQIENTEPVSEQRAHLYLDIAHSYYNKGNYESAIKYFSKSSEILLEVYEGEGGFLADHSQFIALCFQKLQTTDKCIEYFEKALNYAKKIYGEKHLETGTILRNYSNALIEFYNSGTITSLEYCKEVILSAIDIYTEFHEGNEAILYDLYLSFSSVSSCLEEFSDSFRYAESACDFFKELYGEYDSQMARIYLIMGDNYLKATNNTTAEKYYSLALKTYEINKNLFS